jgi:hypothetical protein
MKACGRVELRVQLFSTSTLAGGERTASQPNSSTTGAKGSGTLWTICRRHKSFASAEYGAMSIRLSISYPGHSNEYAVSTSY